MNITQLIHAYKRAQRVNPTLAEQTLKDYGGGATPESVPADRLDDCVRALRRIGHDGISARGNARPTTMADLHDQAFENWNNPTGHNG